MGSRIIWSIIGILAIAGGIFALLNPIAATLAATAIAGWIFIFMGVLQVVGGFQAEGIGWKIWTILLGLLGVFVGFSILQHPLAGIVALTTVVAIGFLIGGAFKVALAFSLENKRFFWVFLLSGAISVVLAIMIFSNFPQSATIILGILLAVELISSGVTMIALAMSDPDETAAA
ncbi:MAG: DUF308 domain-containing protein [Pseudomonadota bacterium]